MIVIVNLRKEVWFNFLLFQQLGELVPGQINMSCEIPGGRLLAWILMSWPGETCFHANEFFRHHRFTTPCVPFWIVLYDTGRSVLWTGYIILEVEVAEPSEPVPLKRAIKEYKKASEIWKAYLLAWRSPFPRWGALCSSMAFPTLHSRAERLQKYHVRF